MSKRFRSHGFRDVTAETISQAGQVFAARLAKREFGRRGYVRTFRADNWAMDYVTATFDAFLGVDRREFYDSRGRPTGEPVCVGRNHMISVSEC